MNISNNVKQYIKKLDKISDEAYKKHKIPKYKNPGWGESIVQERLMRLGIEQRYTGAYTEDELYLLAIATLREDYINHHTRKNKIAVILDDFDRLFEEQIKRNTSDINIFYYLSNEITDQLQVYSATSLEWIKENFSCGICEIGIIPRLYK